MPEGPEVRTTTDFLSTFIGKDVKSFTVLSGRYTKKGGIPNASNVNLPATIKTVNCKGKFIYFTFRNKGTDCHLFSTLGMTGMWTNIKTKHSRVVFVFNDESNLYYNDVRNFGTLKFVDSDSDLEKKLKSLGPDVLTDEINTELFISRFNSKLNKTIAECLMNQSVISGVGNYLKAEILYASRISPNRKVSEINKAEWNNLCFNTLEITKKSYNLGGATIESYRQPNGKEGLYSRRFAVYNQKTDPLGNNVIKEQTLDKRTTHWVPNIQK
tara:strand:+ start:5681 stop:6490 length:810 start_codon:yes stop_codon:yes gene_type:complete